MMPSLGEGWAVPGFSSQGIFLSYRREDTAPYARLLQFQLSERFPDARVFMDLDSIEAGLDFAEVIQEAVDSCAVLERDLAARAGLGWVGKNTNLLTPSLGSYFFIGIVLTTAALPFDQREPDRCGTCTACLDACPTRAFVAPYVLDARRCISYLTIEHRGDIAAELAEQIGEWVFGCDVCQEVCPWNRKAEPGREPALGPSGSFGALETLLELDPEAFRARFRGSPFTRTKRAGLLRNAAIVLANRGEQRAAGALSRALGDEEPVVRHAAAWALEKLGAPKG